MLVSLCYSNKLKHKIHNKIFEKSSTQMNQKNRTDVLAMHFVRVVRVKAFKFCSSYWIWNPARFLNSLNTLLHRIKRDQERRTSETQRADDAVFNDFINSLEIQNWIASKWFASLFPLVDPYATKHMLFENKESFALIMCDAEKDMNNSTGTPDASRHSGLIISETFDCNLYSIRGLMWVVNMYFYKTTNPYATKKYVRLWTTFINMLNWLSNKRWEFL